MAYFYKEPSHTFSEYLLIPGYTSEECVPDWVSLRTPLTKYRKGQEEPAISLITPSFQRGFNLPEGVSLAYSGNVFRDDN